MKHKSLFGRLLILALFIPLVPAVPAALASTWYVNGVNGNDSNDCKSRQHACKTIGHAISLASSGDSIMVAAATYKESLTINFSLKILGSGATTTIINGRRGVFIENRSASVTLSKMTIRNAIVGITSNGTLIVNDSTISGNASGGGIANYGKVTLNRCTISGNTAIGIDGYYSNGGGIYNSGMLTVNSSTISENRAVGNYVCGGGMYNSGTLTINNSTLNGNHARGASNSVGGGIDNEGGTVVLNNSTLSGNKASVYLGGDGSGGGISNGGCVTNRSYPSTTTLRNSIVANSPKGGNCNGSMTSKGYNLSSDNTCNFNGTGDLNNTDPKLGQLGYYGGPTQTIPLLSGSPATDAGNPSGCTDGKGHLLKTDQRGRPRPDKEDAGGCDMGAYERQSD
jgi:hypothetical protein